MKKWTKKISMVILFLVLLYLVFWPKYSLISNENGIVKIKSHMPYGNREDAIFLISEVIYRSSNKYYDAKKIEIYFTRSSSDKYGKSKTDSLKALILDSEQIKEICKYNSAIDFKARDGSIYAISHLTANGYGNY